MMFLQVAEKMQGSGGSVDMTRMGDVVIAIIVSQIVKVTMRDLGNRVEQRGMNSIRQRLKSLLVEKILSRRLRAEHQAN